MRFICALFILGSNKFISLSIFKHTVEVVVVCVCVTVCCTCVRTLETLHVHGQLKPARLLRESQAPLQPRLVLRGLLKQQQQQHTREYVYS